MEKHHFIEGKWHWGKGETFSVSNPSTGDKFYEGCFANDEEVEKVVSAAQRAFYEWSTYSVEQRFDILKNFVEALKENQEHLAQTISLETGKPLWESKTEIASMISKASATWDAYQERGGIVKKESPQGMVNIRHKPLGVLAVLGPFNFPGHLPNGQIMPALLAGNTVVFKPSPMTPLTSIAVVSLWEKAGLYPGALNLIQGGAAVGEKLVTHSGINGLFFTGSYAVGRRIHQLLAGHPEKIVVLEMGGNNPLVVAEVKDVVAAAYYTIQSAYLTAGQRCSCARRLIVPKGEEGDKFINVLVEMIHNVRVGVYTDNPEPFMGPVISSSVAEKLLAVQEDFIKCRANAIVPIKQLHPETGLLSPGLLDVSAVAEREDEEYFGPLLQLIRVKNFSEALQEANNTAYGLTAGILSDNPRLYQEFYQTIKAGIINWNKALTGSSSYAPFGGVGHSGNFRPGGYYMGDACSYPVAGMESLVLQLPEQLTPGIVR